MTFYTWSVSIALLLRDLGGITDLDADFTEPMSSAFTMDEGNLILNLLSEAGYKVSAFGLVGCHLVE